MAREIKLCIAGAKAAKCDNVFLITDHDYDDMVADGIAIKVRPAYEWLTSATSPT